MTQTRLYSPNLLAWPKPASESFTLTGIEDSYQVIKYWGDPAVLRGFITTFIQKSDDLSSDALSSSDLSVIEYGGEETIRADTDQILTFKELVSALDRISRPTEVEDIPLPFDPDDYPVV